MTTGTKRVLGLILPPLVSLLLFAGIFELGVLLVVGEQAKFPRHVVGAEFGVRINEPDAHYRHKSADGTWWFDINGRGLRDERDFPYEKPRGVKRIVSLGDSFTAGYEVHAEETFSHVLESQLRAAGHEVEVLNAGVSGYSNAEALVYLERELLKYDPDVILLSFYANDIVDNVRTGLFQLDADGRLEQTADRYVPAGGLGNFLNTNPVFNWLSGYSNSFVFAKERVTHILKRAIIERNRAAVAESEAAADIDAAAGAVADADAPAANDAPPAEAEGPSPDVQLAVAILDRLYNTARARDIALVIQSIPITVPVGEDKGKLIEVFPVDHFVTARPGLHFVPMTGPLGPLVGKELLYRERSHFHWTPIAHEVSGKTIADLVLREGLIDAPVARTATTTP